jgi:hypothetical protein
MAERELSAFFAAVETLFGPEQANISAEDWIDATEQLLGPNQPTNRDWSQVVHQPGQAPRRPRFYSLEERISRLGTVKC